MDKSRVNLPWIISELSFSNTVELIDSLGIVVLSNQYIGTISLLEVVILVVCKKWLFWFYCYNPLSFENEVVLHQLKSPCLF